MAIEKLKITTLVDNAVATSGLLAEWGFSLFIETEQLNLLFDCGATITPFLHNVRSLDLDLSIVDKVVISHGHNDHIGCLDTVIGSIPNSVEVLTGADPWYPRYYKKKWAGIPHNREYLESLGSQFREIDRATNLSEDILCIGSIPMHTSFESIDDNLFARKGEKLLQDRVDDELVLVLNTIRGLVVVTGCAHRGIVNIVDQAISSTGNDKLYLVIGGAHLMNASAERIDKTVMALKEREVEKIALSHCTGDKAMVKFSQAFGESYIFNKAGMHFECC